MFRNFSYSVVLFASLFAFQDRASAQFPPMDMSQMMQNELQFQQYFYNYVEQRSWELAREWPDDIPLPFNGWTLHQSINDMNRSFDSYNHEWHYNSNRTLDAIDRWDYGAIRNVELFQGPYGGTPYMLPIGPNGYQLGPWGDVYKNLNPYDYGSNLYPIGW